MTHILSSQSTLKMLLWSVNHAGTNSSLPEPAQTFAQQAGIADTAHNREHYAWLFLSTRQQLVAWMRENVHEEVRSHVVQKLYKHTYVRNSMLPLLG
jgi:hypothetical protein